MKVLVTCLPRLCHVALLGGLLQVNAYDISGTHLTKKAKCAVLWCHHTDCDEQSCESNTVRQVSEVQRKFVEKLLENSVFNKHLTAVREINNMLQRAKDVRAGCSEANAGKPMKVCMCVFCGHGLIYCRRTCRESGLTSGILQNYEAGVPFWLPCIVSENGAS